MIRCFVAIDLPGHARDALVAAQAGLPAGRPVERENLHLTLTFLGELPEPQVEDVHYALETIRLPGFPLRLSGLGLLGEGRPQVLHAAVTPEPALSRLRDKVTQAARDAGLALERRRYRPHVTLARCNARLSPEEAAWLRAFAAAGAGVSAGPFTVRDFVLMRSRLGRAGAAYETMARYPLAAPPH